jgi:hypothetical protein
MTRSSLTKIACVFSLLGLAVLPVSAATFWDRASYREPAVTQPGHIEWAWDGGERLGVGVPATVHYSEQGAPRVVVTGSDEMLRRVRFGDGNIVMDNDGDFFRNSDHERLDITVTGVALNEFSVSGSGKLLLGKLKRDWLGINVSGSGSTDLEASVSGDAELKVSGSGHITFGALEAKNLKAHISGSGGIDGKGHVGNLDLDMSGSGRFADIAASRANVTMSGSGRATIAARDQARVRISGSATVRMPTKPPQLDVSVSGSGHVVTASAD